MELTPPCLFLIPPEDPVAPASFPSPAVSAGRPLHRVGDYVERLVRRWLEITPRLSAIEQGLVIRDGKRTVGELDFLFRHDGALHHLEIALKFYLHFPGAGAESSVAVSHFPGPNATDNFEKKRDKLLSHQLPLGRNSFPEVTASHAMVKGIVFYRPGEGPPEVLPVTMNPAHLRGTWIRSPEIDRLLDDPDWRHGGSCILKKPHWLSGWTVSAGEELLPMSRLHSLLRSHFETADRPVMVSLVREGEDQESERLIVVAADWPNHRA